MQPEPLPELVDVVGRLYEVVIVDDLFAWGEPVEARVQPDARRILVNARLTPPQREAALRAAVRSIAPSVLPLLRRVD